MLEIRQIGDPFEGYDPPSWARSRAGEEGWWHDHLSHCWRAPDEYIAKPYQEPREVEALAAAMSPPEWGWIDLTLASEETSVTIRCSSVFDPIRELLGWLESIIAGNHPRMSIDQEGSHAELHVLPGTLKAREQQRVDERSPRVQFVVLIDRAEVMDVELNILIPRRALVFSLYSAWQTVQRYDSARIRRHWSGEWGSDSEAQYDGATLRSVAIEEWLSKALS